ncbi:MAG: Crp/Fnr family transcriptional regulator [Dehalococcoidales bacterium]|nr:Crp/Fnr family transcriptional regulator [Dehalococcoidales bacterium]
MYLEWIDTLKSALLFRGIGSDSLNIMLDCLKPTVRRTKQREIIVAYGQPFQGIGIIASGKVALSKETYSGNRIIMEILEAGDVFGEVVAFSDRRIWPMTVIAQEDCVLLFLPPDKITGACSNICSSHSTLIINMLRILSNRAAMLDKKIEHISSKNIRGRISSYLLDIYLQSGNKELTLTMKRHELADYLNIPRPSLSREMGSMRDDGIIEFEGSHVTVKNVLKLEKSIQ